MPKRLALTVVVLVLASGMLAGCSNATPEDAGAPADSSAEAPADQGGGDAGTGTAASPGTVDGVAAPGLADIPDGTAIASDGNPEYTFRTLWQRGLERAQSWKADAYLVAASGRDVNDEGVPSEWSLTFRSVGTPGSVDRVWIDPWGNVSREESGDDEGTYQTIPIAADIIDSDEAVTLGREAIAAKYDLKDSKDPGIGLAWSVEGDKLLWEYVVFYRPTADYVEASIDAVSGEVVSVP